MTKHIIAGSQAYGDMPIPASKEFIADKNSTVLYAKCIWHGTNHGNGTVGFKAILSSSASENDALATSNPVSFWDSNSPITKYYTFNYNLVAGQHYFLLFVATINGFYPGISDVVISTDPIP